jgi:hypothetical protein
MPAMKHLALLVVAACSSGPEKDWSKKPLEMQKVTIDGFTYALDVPKGLPTDSDEKPGVWNVTKFEGDHVPKIFSGIDREYESIDKFISWQIINKDKMNIVRKETRPDGYAFTDAPANKRRIEATTLKKIGDKWIECTAVQVNDGDVPSYDATRAMLEKICDSVRAP